MNPEKNINKIKTTTLKEFGNVLPVGIDHMGKIHRGLEFKAWRMPEEKYLGSLRNDFASSSMSKYTTIVLAAMATKFGPWDFSEMKLEERLVHMASLTMPDIFYAYILLRIQAMENELHLDISCPDKGCESFPFIADLNTIEVSYVDDPRDALWAYTLKRPFKSREKEIKGLMMGPTRWNAMELLPDGSNVSEATASIIEGSIYGVVGDPEHILLPQELDMLEKVDIQGISNQLDKNSLGPNMAVDCKCPKCSRDIKVGIDWSYDSFFGLSSQ